jgi:hypothetical protein
VIRLILMRFWELMSFAANIAVSYQYNILVFGLFLPIGM